MTTMLARHALPGRFTTETMRLLLRKGIDTLLVWQDRARERRHLAALDDRLLRDMGITRGTVASEVEKPFWLA
jgi:uncharacterized protein YjiS (DUF1127 family)